MRAVHKFCPSRSIGGLHPHSPDVSQLLGALGAGNGGVFSRAEAIGSGETDKSLLQAQRAGVIVRLRRGMYVAGDIYSSSDNAGRHLLLARAALAAQQGEAVLAGISAAALHGFALYDQDLSVVHLLRLDAGSGRRAAQANHHRRLPPLTETELGVFGGVRAVSPARAVWEVAALSSLEAAVVTADAALRREPTLKSALLELQPRFANTPGSRTARLAMRLADGRSESPGESITRVQFHRFDIPQPEPQFEVRDASGHLLGRSDFGWDEFRHLAEFDGKEKYEKYRRPGESVSACVVREKSREDQMRGSCWGMSRFVWATVMPAQAARTMAGLHQALRQSRRLYVPVEITFAS